LSRRASIPPASTGWFYEPTILTGCTRTWRSCARSASARLPPSAGSRISTKRSGLPMTARSVSAPRCSPPDLEEAMEAAERLEAGMVWVNNPMIDNDALPFGGWKASGIGPRTRPPGARCLPPLENGDHRPQAGDPEWWYPYPDSWFYEDRRPQARLRTQPSPFRRK
jgi:hypothetical protein